MKTEGLNRSEAIREYVAKHKGLTTREVVEGLAKTNVKVSAKLVAVATKGKGIKVNKRKLGKKGKKTAGKTDNMSARIREYADAHPKDGPKEVQEGLQGMGVEVSYPLVKAVLTRHRGTVQKRKYGKRKGTTMTAPDLQAGVKFVRQVGSVEVAKEVVALLAEIRMGLK